MIIDKILEIVYTKYILLFGSLGICWETQGRKGGYASCIFKTQANQRFSSGLYSEYRKSAVNNFIVDKILAFLQAFFL